MVEASKGEVKLSRVQYVGRCIIPWPLFMGVFCLVFVIVYLAAPPRGIGPFFYLWLILLLFLIVTFLISSVGFVEIHPFGVVVRRRGFPTRTYLFDEMKSIHRKGRILSMKMGWGRGSGSVLLLNPKAFGKASKNIPSSVPLSESG